MSKLNKHLNTDKYDAYIPVRDNFIHEDGNVGMYSEKLHLPRAYGYNTKNRRNGFVFGIQKKVDCVSPRGIFVDRKAWAVGTSDS